MRVLVWSSLNLPGRVASSKRAARSKSLSLPAMQSSFAQIGVPFCGASVLNSLPKIALGKWSIEKHDGFLRILTKDGVALFPTGDLKIWYSGILQSLEEGRSVRLIPEFIADALKPHFKVIKQHYEYVVRTERVKTLSGVRNANVRNEVNKARKLCTIEDYNSSQVDEYKNVVRLWYRQNASLKFRTYDKTSIDWLLENWANISAHVPDTVCLGVRYQGTLISLSMGCKLSCNYWHSYTHRFNRDAPVQNGNKLGYNELASRFSSLEFENNGIADTTALHKQKARLACMKVPIFKVER